jgi:GTP:adenosylcobinamide-phosphate guanylyltransferase
MGVWECGGVGVGNKIPAVVLAGAPADAEMAEKYSIRSRADLPLAGKKMIQHVMDALAASPHVGDVCVVGDIQCGGASRIIPPAGDLVENLIAGVKALGEEAERVLVVTSDIPMLTSEAVEDFIARCAETEADFHYAIISKETAEKRFPGMKRTYAKLAEGTFTGGNIFLVSRGCILENAEPIRELMAARKSVLRLARIIGIRFLVRALVAQVLCPCALNLRGAEKTVGRVFRMRVKAVETPYAEIGADVDKLEHVDFAEKALSEGASSTSKSGA